MNPDREILSAAVDLHSRADRLRQIAERLDAQAEALERDVAGADAETIILRGASITEKLAELVDVGDVLHYTELNHLLRAAGFVCSGKDSGATLLASLSRTGDFELVQRRSGKWRRVSL